MKVKRKLSSPAAACWHLCASGLGRGAEATPTPRGPLSSDMGQSCLDRSRLCQHLGVTAPGDHTLGAGLAGSEAPAGPGCGMAEGRAGQGCGQGRAGRPGSSPAPAARRPSGTPLADIGPSCAGTWAGSSPPGQPPCRFPSCAAVYYGGHGAGFSSGSPLPRRMWVPLTRAANF